MLDEELASTLFTIAHDVKIQVEFNPAYVREYRLIGYENRALREEDFDNDAVDAGEIGAGHQVTALYEIVPAGRRGWLPGARSTRTGASRRRIAARQGEQLAHLRLRYKLPGESQSRLIEQPVGAGLIANARPPAGDTAFIAAVAAYGQLLRGDTNLGGFTFADARALARAQCRRQLLAARVRAADRAGRAAPLRGRRRRQIGLRRSGAGVHPARRRSAFAAASSPS